MNNLSKGDCIAVVTTLYVFIVLFCNYCVHNVHFVGIRFHVKLSAFFFLLPFLLSTMNIELMQTVYHTYAIIFL